MNPQTPPMLAARPTIGLLTPSPRHIFEPFFTTKPAGEGNGLGLDICRNIAAKHRGTITVESRPGNTMFTVRRPMDLPPL